MWFVHWPGCEGVKGTVSDYCVVGAGIVGLATAVTLLERRPGADVVVLEKEPDVARHQTGHNSGVLHAGVYYPPGSLKARLCREGARWTREFCDEHAVPYRDTGKLVVATDEAERGRMHALHERALANGLHVEVLDAGALREREPHVVGVGALWVAASGIVDYRQVCRALVARLRALGGRLALGSEVSGIDESPGQVAVDVRGGQAVTARHVVVCAGLQADRLARLAGLDVDFAIVPFRGEYYRLSPSRNDIVSTLVYPVPDPALPFLGVHLTLTMDGGVTVGPNAVLGLAREGYRKGALDGRDVAALARFPGFWKLARAQARTGLLEQWNSLYKPGYLRLVRKYCPELTVADLQPEPAGIRAQAVRADGTLVDDFLLRRTERTLHVCNAPSPAATSAMPIAALIAEQVLADR